LDAAETVTVCEHGCEYGNGALHARLDDVQGMQTERRDGTGANTRNGVIHCFASIPLVRHKKVKEQSKES
jgi:hypothetical protein